MFVGFFRKSNAGKSQKKMAKSFLIYGESTRPMTRTIIMELAKKMLSAVCCPLKQRRKNHSRIRTKPTRPRMPRFTHMVKKILCG